MNWAQLYADLSAQLQAHVDLPFYQDFFVNFYRAFIDGARWKLYLSGLRMTIEVTVLALIMGIILGVIVAVIRTAHDQQRPGRHNPILFLLNTIGTIYTTVIRGTPMIVQMLIMGSIIFASSRNFTVIGTIALGINSGAYVAEIIRGGLMSLDPGQAEAGRSLGLNYFQTMRFIVIPQAFKAILPALGNEFITLFHRPHHRHRRQGAAVRGQGRGREDLQRDLPLPGRGGDVPGPGHHPDLAPG